MKSTLLLIPLLFFMTSCTIDWNDEKNQENNYYKNLLDECLNLDNWERGGCITSVKWMQQNNFKEAINKTCPEGTSRHMNKTRGSKSWCETIINSGESSPKIQELGFIKDSGSGFVITESGNVSSVFYDKRFILKTGNEISPPTILSITGTTQFILIREYLSETNKDTIFDIRKGEIVNVPGRYPVLNNISMTSSGTLVLENQGFDGGRQVIEYDPIRNLVVLDGKSLGEGFILSQTDDETMLSYSGKVIKTWSHTPPENVPFIWDEACSIVWKGFEKLPPEDQSTGKQGVWDALTEKEKKECIKNKLQETIEIKSILDGIFFEIRQVKYEGYQSWIVFSKNGNTQEAPIQFQNPKVSFSNSGINIFLTNNYDGNDIKLLYTNDFSQLLSKEEIPKQ